MLYDIIFKLDLSEEALNEAVTCYMEVVQSLQKHCESIIRNFEERIKEHPHKQLENMVNTYIELYNTDVQVAIREAIREWSSSGESFAKLRQKVGDEDCSSESVLAAEKIQEDIEKQVTSYFTSISKIRIDKLVQVDEKVIRTEQIFVDEWFKELEELKFQWKNFFEDSYSERAIYLYMVSLVMETFINVERIYEEATIWIFRMSNNRIGLCDDHHSAIFNRRSVKN